jgi:hypothetical protein
MMNSRAKSENQSALSEQVKHGRDKRDNPGTWGGELGQPVRNTCKPGLRPNTEDNRTSRDLVRRTRIPVGSHTATPDKNRMPYVLAARV